MSSRLTADEFYNECVGKPLDMVMMRRVFLLLTRMHWSDGNNHYQQPNPFECLVYSDIEKDRKLDVELTDVYDESDTDKFPGIFVGFHGGFKLNKLSINYDGDASEDSATENRKVSWSGKLHIKHVHNSADIAITMADSSFVFIMAVRSSLMELFPIRRLDLIAVTEPANVNPENANRFFKVDLVADIEFIATVNVSLESHRIKKWSSELNPQPYLFSLDGNKN